MTEEQQQKNTKGSIREKILEDIRSGHVSMRPKLLFTLKLAVVVAVSILVLFVSVFIFNFIMFSIRINHNEALLGFGTRGLFRFLRFFPWTMLLTDIALIILFAWLVRRFKFGYRSPVLPLLLTFLGATLVFGAVIDRGTPFNDVVLEGAESLPAPMRNFYSQAEQLPPKGTGICFCTVLSVGVDKLTLEDERDADDKPITVTLPPDMPVLNISPGDHIFVAGEESDGMIKAFGISKFPPPRHRRMMMR
jgi:hypothetical protein